jgi:hypothetical protein
MACRAGGLTVRASSTRHRASVNVRFEPGDRDVGADRAAQGFVTRWWWRVPDGEFGLPQDLLDAGRPVRVVHCVGEERDRRWPSPRMRTAPLIEPTRVLTERARTFRRVWIIGSRPVSVFFRRMQGSTMFAWPPEAPHTIQDLRLGHDPLGVAHQERSSSHSAAVSAITSPPPRSAGVPLVHDQVPDHDGRRIAGQRTTRAAPAGCSVAVYRAVGHHPGTPGWWSGTMCSPLAADGRSRPRDASRISERAWCPDRQARRAPPARPALSRRTAIRHPFRLLGPRPRRPRPRRPRARRPRPRRPGRR